MLNKCQSVLDWSPLKRAAFGKIPLRLNHSLHNHPLFSDEALARLLENVDRDDYFVNTMRIDAHDVRSRRDGEIRELSGKAVLDAVKNGRIWILLLHPDRVDPRYKDILNEIYAEIEENQPGLKTSFRKMTILISSPRIQVYYHCDIPGQSLWQVRGNKMVYLYPNVEPFLNQAALEKVVTGEYQEFSIPYDPQFDEYATVYDLQPGEMLHWPLNAPHRISNGDCLNVSFTTEHFSPPIRRMYHVNFANGILRRFGVKNPEQNISGPAYWSKLALVTAYKVAGLHKRGRKKVKVDFRVDPRAPDAVLDIGGYEFQR